MNRFPFSVLDPSGKTIAFVLLSDDAMTLVAGYGDGASILHESGRTIWREGEDDTSTASDFERACIMVADTVRRLRIQN